jgi:glutamate decarboxylase
MLGVLAMKWAWRARREAAGKPTDRPNIVVPSCIHVCHEKAALYFDVELRQVPLTPDALTVPASAIVARCDENTIGVVAVLGSTYTGHFDDVAALSDALEVFNAANGTDIGIHVDGASGGFVAPFLFPDLKADFRVPRVVSINMSGHKFGLMVAG